jgi:hypothetical protein
MKQSFLYRYPLYILIVVALIAPQTTDCMEIFGAEATQALKNGLADSLKGFGENESKALSEGIETSIDRGIQNQALTDALTQIKEELGAEKYNAALKNLGENLGDKIKKGTTANELATSITEDLKKTLKEAGIAQDSTKLLNSALDQVTFSLDLSTQDSLSKIESTQLTTTHVSDSGIIQEEPILTESSKTAKTAGDTLSSAELKVHQEQALLESLKADSSTPKEKIAEAENNLNDAKNNRAKSLEDYNTLKNKELPSAQTSIERARLKDQYGTARTNRMTLEKELKSVKSEAESPEQMSKKSDLEKKLSAARSAEEFAHTEITRSKLFTSLEKIQQRLQHVDIKATSISALKATGTLARDFLNPMKLLETMVSGFVFMFPGWIQEKIVSDNQRKAAYATVLAPQKIGAMWVQIPQQLINVDDPNNSVFVYAALPNVSADEAARMEKGERVREVSSNAQTDFFVTLSDYGALGRYPITTNPTGQLLHLNSGLEIYANGTAINPIDPLRQLLGPLDTRDNKSQSVVAFLRSIGSKIHTGAPLVKSYDMLQNAGKTSTSQAQGSPTIASLMETPDYDTYAKIMTTSRDTWNSKYKLNKSTFSIQGISPLNSALVKDLTGQDVAFPTNLPMAGSYNIFVYQTDDTMLAHDINTSLGLTGAKRLFDYVLALDASFHPIPAIIPVINIHNSLPTYTTNNSVIYLYSLIDSKLTKIEDGTIADLPVSLPTLEKLFANAPLLNPLMKQCSLIKNFIATQRLRGPFTVGSAILSIPPLLSQGSENSLYEQGVYIYQAKGKVADLLEGASSGNYTDYVVPLDSHATPVKLSNSEVKYFVSLVTSRIYNADMALTINPIAFSLLQIGAQAYAIPAPADTQLQSKLNGTYLSEQGSKLQANLATFQVEWEFNPYNKQPLVAILASSLETQLNSAPSSTMQSLRTGGTLPRGLTSALAFWINRGLQDAGITDSMLTGKDSSAIVSQLIAQLSSVVTQTHSITPGTSIPSIIDALKTSLPNSFNNPIPLGQSLARALHNEAAAITAFNNLGTVLKEVSLPATGASLTVRLATQGKIPTSPLYALNPPKILVTAGKTTQGIPAAGIVPLWGKDGTISTYDLLNQTPLLPLYNDIINAHNAWTAYQISHTETWASFNDMGPFNFTNQLFSNTIIQGVSLEALRNGAYIYTSPTYPQQYFLVCNQIEIPRAEKFDPGNPQTYLISLTTDTVYQRQNDGSIKPLKDPLSVTTSIINTLPASIQKDIITSRNNYKASTPSILYFNRFSLFLDPQDAAAGKFVYQDISSLANPENLSPTQLLQQAQDFFVAAGIDTSGNPQDIGKELDASATVIMSLTTANVYKRDQGYFSHIASDTPGQAQQQLLHQMGTLRNELQQAITTLINNMAKEYNAEQAEVQKALAQESVFTPLASNTVANITVSECLPLPYNRLKQMGATYFGVAFSSDITGGQSSATCKGLSLLSIFDYKSGILYDAAGKGIKKYSDWMTQTSRNLAGVVVTNGREKLGIPNLYPTLPLLSSDSKTSTLVPTGISKKSGTDTYNFHFNNDPGVQAYFALVTPSQGTPYYLDINAGYIFDTDGKPIRQTYPCAQGGFSGTTFLIVGSDAAHNPRVQFSADESLYHDYTFATSQGNMTILDSGAPLDRILFQATPTNQYTIQQQSDVDDPQTGTIPFGDPETFTIVKETAEQLDYLATSQKATFDEAAQFITGNNHPLFIVRNSAHAIVKVLYRKPNSEEPIEEIIYVPKGTPLTDSVTKAITYTLTATDPYDDSIVYTIVLKDNIIDNDTKATYVTVRDNAKTFFYTYRYKLLATDDLLHLQSTLGLYPVIDSTGISRLIPPLNPILKSIQAILGIPVNERDRVQQNTTNLFKYDPTTDRYVYVLTSNDKAEGIYPNNAQYLDIESGISFDNYGKPTGGVLLQSQLLELLNTNHVRAPGLQITPVTDKSGVITDYVVVKDSKGNPLRAKDNKFGLLYLNYR